jgi:transcriptional regulator with XRE-family HTH domain
VDNAKVFGKRLREVRSWRGLDLHAAGGLAGLSFSFWGQVERGEKPVTNRNTLEAMASALRVHPSELTGQPWTAGRREYRGARWVTGHRDRVGALRAGRRP